MNIIKDFLDRLEPVAEAVENELNEWKEDSNLQVPKLLNSLALKLNWDDKKVRQMDSVVRLYIHDHPDWHITRGAGGGIQRKSIKDKKEQDKILKDAAKLEIKKMLEAKLANESNSSTNPTDALDKMSEELSSESEEI